MENILLDPLKIAEEYKSGSEYKASIDKGIAHQAKINERFYVGDQWYGASVGNNRPLVRRNIIKRIGEYKLAIVTAPPIAVNYSADGIPTADYSAEENPQFSKSPDSNEISYVLDALSGYFDITAERVKFDKLKEQAIRNAYISGTGILYTYWDERIKTGLYADEAKTTPIVGDIACEVVDVENIVFGDPNSDDIQNQPYITLAQRKTVGEVKREAKRFGTSASEIDKIVSDEANEYTTSGDRGNEEFADSKRVTVYTKFYKEYAENGIDSVVKVIKTTEKAVVRDSFDIKIRQYPFAVIPWERRHNCVYGDSEITYLIPNQIAINRCLTAEVWGLMMNGMPITIVNGDVIEQRITNNPGQIITVNSGPDFMMNNVIAHVQPPSLVPQFQSAVNDMASNTLSDSGANDAALGNLRPDNAAAIIQMREAATAPMQTYLNRFYDFCEDVARIWAEFWVNLYGDRQIKVETKEGTNYIPFIAERYKNLHIIAKIDVGASTLWGESVVISTLDSLLANGFITFPQYLERMPSGIIPDITGLKNELSKPAMPTGDEMGGEADILEMLKQQNPQAYEQYMSLPPEQQAQMLQSLQGETIQGAEGL